MRGTPCALCGKVKYSKNMVFVDKYKFSDGTEIYWFETKFKEHHVCKDCASKFLITTYNGDRAYIAIEKNAD